ncbi:hypothetical protein BRN02_07265, partial [Xanthomonas oryzae pv. oryzae]
MPAVGTAVPKSTIPNFHRIAAADRLLHADCYTLRRQHDTVVLRRRTAAAPGAGGHGHASQ